MGKILRYNVTLDEEVVEEAKKHSEKWGGKLSPLINVLLKKWLKEEGEKDG